MSEASDVYYLPITATVLMHSSLKLRHYLTVDKECGIVMIV